MQGWNFGWPYCFFDYGQKKFLLNTEYGGDGKEVGRCTEFTAAVASFPAHWAPVDIMFYSGAQFPKKYQGGTFIAFHGSWNRVPMPQSKPLQSPDGMRSVGGRTLLLVEGAGRLDEVTITGDKAEINVLKDGLMGPTAVTLAGGMAYVSEARLNYRNDPKLRDQDPGPFRAVGVPYKTPK